MKGKDLLVCLSFADERYIQESENEPLSMEGASPKNRLTLRRPVMIASVIALVLCLVGCSTVIYLTEAEYPGSWLPRVAGNEVPHEDIRLTVIGASPNGIALSYEIEDFKEEENSIFVLTNAPFTLEEKTEEGWKELPRKIEDPEWVPKRVLNTGSYEWSVGWVAEYGLLQPGHYRFTTVILEGNDPVPVEFILEEEGEDLETAREMLEREFYHVRMSSQVVYENLDKIPAEESQYRNQFEREKSEYVDEFFKWGEDLLNLTYRDGELYMGVMYKDGIKYKLTNENPETRLSPIAGWEVWPDYDLNRITSWGDLILQEEHEVLRNAAGEVEKIVGVTASGVIDTFGVTSQTTTTAEVLPDTKEQVEAVFAAQDTDFCREFSWQKDQKNLPALDVEFKNTTPQPITTSAEAISRADKECNVEATQIVVYRDEKAGMWKVEYQIMYGYQGYQYVYMNDEGITQMISGAGSKVEEWKESFPDPTH